MYLKTKAMLIDSDALDDILITLCDAYAFVTDQGGSPQLADRLWDAMDSLHDAIEDGDDREFFYPAS